MQRFTDAFNRATSFFSRLKEQFEGSENVDVWVATLIDWDNQHEEMGDVQVEIPTAGNLPTRSLSVDLYYRKERDCWTVKYREGDASVKEFWHFDTLDNAKERIEEIVNSITSTRPRADRYGSRERERRLRQDERRLRA